MAKLFDGEARINKNKTLSYGKRKTDNRFNIINPIKGEFSEIESDLKELCDMNPNNIFVLSIKNGNNKLYISKAKMIGNDNLYGVLDQNLITENSVCTWDFICKKYKDLDITVVKTSIYE